MKSFQTRLFEQLEKIANEHGCELVQKAEYANTGTLMALEKGAAYKLVARLRYSIHDGISEIRFNGTSDGPWLDPASPYRRRNPDCIYFRADEPDKVNAVFTRWAALL